MSTTGEREMGKDKNKFRASKKWKDWRIVIYHKDMGKDYITGSKLYKGYHLHHLDLREKNYTNLDDENRFLSLNKQSHDLVHWAYQYWIKDEDFLKRLEQVLKWMKEYSND